MSKEKQIEERIELSDIIDYALRDWDDYIYECQEEGNCPIDTFEEWIADAVLKNGYHKQSEWISVEERLPENDWGNHWAERKYYLVYTKPSGLMNVATYGYKEHGWWVDRNSCVLDKKNYKEVTHWMPLPEAPKGGGE